MKIGFVSIEDAACLTPNSIHSYYEAKALRDQGLEVRFLGPLALKRTPAIFVRRLISRLFQGNRFLPYRDPVLVQDLARQVMEKLDQTPVDLIFSYGTIPISLLDCHIPVVFWSDATFAGMIGFYSGYTHLNQASLRSGNLLEQSALDRAAMAFYSSEWARRTCLENYRVDPAKVKVVPFGANLAYEPSLADVESNIRARAMQPCRLVFVGTEWERKGGDLALGLAALLHRSGLLPELIVIGSKPTAKIGLPDYVRVIRYIDTSSSTGQDTYREQLARSHFLVLPTWADCSPRVLYEAGSLGLPCLATDVGGISSIIHPGVNGGLFPTGQEFVKQAAAFVMEAMHTSVGYRELAVRTVVYHQENHTWDRATSIIKTLLAGILPVDV